MPFPTPLFLVNRQNGNLITYNNQTMKLSSDWLKSNVSNLDQFFEVNANSSFKDTYTIEAYGRTLFLSHYGDTSVDLDNDNDGTNTMWTFKQIDTNYNSAVWEISNVNDGSYLTANGSNITCMSHTGNKSQQWLASDSALDALSHVHQAIIKSDQDEINNLNNQVQQLQQQAEGDDVQDDSDNTEQDLEDAKRDVEALTKDRDILRGFIKGCSNSLTHILGHYENAQYQTMWPEYHELEARARRFVEQGYCGPLALDIPLP